MGRPGVLALLGQRLPAAPHLIDAEVAHALRGLLAGRKLAEPEARLLLQRWRGFPLERVPMPGLLPRVWELRANLTAYDALFVATAEALEAPLLTADRRLANAPGSRCVIELLPS